MENKLRIVVFAPFYPPHVGGMESHAEEFNEYAAKHGAQIIVFTPHIPRSSKREEYPSSNITIVRFPAFEVISGYPIPSLWNRLFWKQLYTLATEQYDIVISRTRFFIPSLIALIFAKYKHSKLLHIEHGSDFVQSNNRVYSWIAYIYDKTIGTLVLRSADAVVANSEASASFVQNLTGNKVTAQVIYRGVNTERIKNTPPNTNIRRLYSNKIIITFIGRLIGGKGVSDLLSALAIMRTDGIENFHCVIIGDGSQKKALQKIVRNKKLASHVTFYGQQSSQEAIAILKASDIFVNPSYTEGLPTSVIEAAFCKKAIIATAVGGTSEIISDSINSYLIPPRNANLLAERLSHLVRNPDQRVYLGTAAYQAVHGTFDWNRAMRQYREIFSSFHT